MGTGKTTVGLIVAEILDMPFVDTDRAVEEMAGKSIPEIFVHSGEAMFRKLESIVCLHAAISGGQVLSIGGGALLNPESRRALEDSGLLICLTASAEAIVERVAGDPHRPLAGNRESLAALLTEREAVYGDLPYQIDTTSISPGEVAAEVISLWQQVYK
jgi:shikimate kinase